MALGIGLGENMVKSQGGAGVVDLKVEARGFRVIGASDFAGIVDDMEAVVGSGLIFFEEVGPFGGVAAHEFGGGCRAIHENPEIHARGEPPNARVGEKEYCEQKAEQAQGFPELKAAQNPAKPGEGREEDEPFWGG